MSTARYIPRATYTATVARRDGDTAILQIPTAWTQTKEVAKFIEWPWPQQVACTPATS